MQKNRIITFSGGVLGMAIRSFSEIWMIDIEGLAESALTVQKITYAL